MNHLVKSKRGFIGLMLLLIGCAIVIILFMGSSRFRTNGGGGPATLLEGQAALEAAKGVQQLGEARSAQIEAQLQ